MNETSESSNGRTWGRIAIILIVAILLVNVPISELGTSLLHIVPETTSVAIAEGMVLQGSGSELYLLHNYRLRPFSSADAFHHFSKRQRPRVQPVADTILTQYGHGPPIYHLVQCPDDPTVYALEEGLKRPFFNPPTPSPADRPAYWDQIETINCQRLDDLPTGPPMPDND